MVVAAGGVVVAASVGAVAAGTIAKPGGAVGACVIGGLGNEGWRAGAGVGVGGCGRVTTTGWAGVRAGGATATGTYTVLAGAA